jgi:hypothetical protein
VLVFPVVSFILALPPITYMHSSSPIRATCPAHLILRDHSNYTWRRVQVMKLLIMQFSKPPVTSSLFGPNIVVNTLFSNTLSLCFFINVSDQVSHPYKTTSKNIILYIQFRSPLWQFVKSLFLRRGVVSLTPNPQAGGPLLVGCPRLLIQYTRIRSYPPYLVDHWSQF